MRTNFSLLVSYVPRPQKTHGPLDYAQKEFAICFIKSLIRRMFVTNYKHQEHQLSGFGNFVSIDPKAIVWKLTVTTQSTLMCNIFFSVVLNLTKHCNCDRWKITRKWPNIRKPLLSLDLFVENLFETSTQIFFFQIIINTLGSPIIEGEKYYLNVRPIRRTMA